MYHATEMPFHPSCNYFPRRAYTRDALESLINNLLSTYFKYLKFGKKMCYNEKSRNASLKIR
jgi:hypothetical protein